ncbi:hypothetical protein QJS04_geneDACA009398 [Acorus gramineus]|uniref:Outer envelope protein 61 n=1 Tax=Acorus gramineus TaxID=55184 RepID=A0AAV9AJV4_ACOGR|nr:hypothetical protein QJS04_geneDACA009398 [Acorus gramineus]
MKEGGQPQMTQGVIIEEITNEENKSIPSEVYRSLDAERSGRHPLDGGECSQYGQSHTQAPDLDSDYLQNFKDNPEAVRSFQKFLSNNPESLASLGSGGMSPEMLKVASDTINKMKPEEIQKMLEVASSLKGNSPFFPGAAADTSSNPVGLPPEMVKTATDMIGRMSEEERQQMFKVTSSLNDKSPYFPMGAAESNSQRSRSTIHSSGAVGTSGSDENSISGERNRNIGSSSSTIPSSRGSVQEQMTNPMKDPAMRQMLTSMMRSMSPEMMADMSQQFGIKLSKEEAEKAQQALSSLSPDSLEKMMLWAERAQKAAHHARRMKNWLLGRPGMILAICMLILAFILHQLGFMGS